MNGNKNVVRTSSESLWFWGTIPQGQYLENGSLKPIATSTIYYPSFQDIPHPILLNRTMDLSGVYFPPDFSSPYFMNDPWFISQMTGRPVILQQ